MLGPGVRVEVRCFGGIRKVATVVRVELPYLVWLDDGLPGGVHPSRCTPLPQQLSLWEVPQ